MPGGSLTARFTLGQQGVIRGLISIAMEGRKTYTALLATLEEDRRRRRREERRRKTYTALLVTLTPTMYLLALSDQSARWWCGGLSVALVALGCWARSVAKLAPK